MHMYELFRIWTTYLLFPINEIWLEATVNFHLYMKCKYVLQQQNNSQEGDTGKEKHYYNRSFVVFVFFTQLNISKLYEYKYFVESSCLQFGNRSETEAVDDQASEPMSKASM